MLALTPEQRKAALRVILVTVFLDILGFGVVIPQLGVYSTQFGASGIVIGLLASSYSAMQFLFSPFWGRLSDRIGRRPVLLWSIFGTGVGYILFALANSLPWLFASRLLDGVTGANISAAQAYLSDITEPDERAKTFGLFGAIFGIGFVLGPMIGLGLSNLPTMWGIAWGGNFGVGVFTASLSFINWLMALRRLPETLPPHVRALNAERHAQNQENPKQWKIIDIAAFSHALKLPGLSLLIPIGLLATLAFANMQGTYTPFLIVSYIRPTVQKEIKTDTDAATKKARDYLSGEEKPAAKSETAAPAQPPTQPFSATMGGDFSLPRPPPAGLSWRRLEQVLVQHDAIKLSTTIFAFIGIISIIVQGGLIGPLKKWFGEVPLIVTGTFLMAVGLATVPLPHIPLGQFFVMFLLAGGNGISTPLLTAMVSEYAPESERGEVMGIYQSVQSLGRIGGPLMGGVLFEVAHGAPYFAGGAIMLVAFGLAFGLHKLPERPRESEIALSTT